MSNKYIGIIFTYFTGKKNIKGCAACKEENLSLKYNLYSLPPANDVFYSSFF